MKRIFSCIRLAILLGAFLTGCSMGPEQMKAVPITDEARVETLHNITKEAMATYFDVTIEDDVNRIVEVSESYVLVDLPSETYLYRNNIIKATAKGDPVEGEIYSYGASIHPETNKVTGAIVVSYSKEKPKEYSVEQLKQTAMTFIEEKKIVENPNELIFEGTEKGISTKQYTGLKFKYNEDNVLVSINLQTGEVSHFEYVEAIEGVQEQAK